MFKKSYAIDKNSNFNRELVKTLWKSKTENLEGVNILTYEGRILAGKGVDYKLKMVKYLR